MAAHPDVPLDLDGAGLSPLLTQLRRPGHGALRGMREIPSGTTVRFKGADAMFGGPGPDIDERRVLTTFRWIARARAMGMPHGLGVGLLQAEVLQDIDITGYLACPSSRPRCSAAGRCPTRSPTTAATSRPCGTLLDDAAAPVHTVLDREHAERYVTTPRLLDRGGWLGRADVEMVLQLDAWLRHLRVRLVL